MRAPAIRKDSIPYVENAVVWVAAVFGIVATVATLGIVVAFVASVVMRWLGDPFDVTNLVSGLLVLATFSGLAWTTVRGEHVSVQVITERLNARVNHILDLIIWTLASGYMGWLIWTAFDRAISRTWPVQEMIIDGVGLAPLWPWRWVFAIAMIPFFAVVLVNLVRSIMGRRPYDDVMELEELIEREGGLLDADLDGDGVIDVGEALKAGSLAAGSTLESDPPPAPRTTDDHTDGGSR